MNRIYFDYASTTPVDPRVLETMTPFFYEHFGNASSPHSIGQEAQKALSEAREQVAAFIGAGSGEIVFNSGATEGNNHAIFGIAQALKKSHITKPHIIISSIEHHSVLEPTEYLQKQGWQVTYLAVDHDGVISPDDIKKVITDQTILVAVMHASNEIGSIQPVKEVSAITREIKIPLVVDACQTVGHIPVNVQDLGCDILTMSGHKFYGPKGVGAMYIREGTKVGRIMMGGDQEMGRRASTQNVAGAIGMARAIEICKKEMSTEEGVQSRLRDRLLNEVPEIIAGVKINGHLTNRLPNNIHFSFENLQGESLLMSLDMKGLCASMGSACTSGAMEPSHVLQAIGLSDEMAYGALRITLGRWTTDEHVNQLLDVLPDVVKSLRI